MDWKLLIRMVFTFFVASVIIGLLVGLLDCYFSSQPFRFDFNYTVVYTFMMTVMYYYYQIDLGLALGIKKGDEHYMKTSFSESVVSSLSAEQLIQTIKSSEHIIEEVYVNGVLIKKRKSKSLVGRVNNIIETKDEGKGLSCTINTDTRLPWFGLIRYSAFKSFTKIKEIITAA